MKNANLITGWEYSPKAKGTDCVKGASDAIYTASAPWWPALHVGAEVRTVFKSFKYTLGSI